MATAAEQTLELQRAAERGDWNRAVELARELLASNPGSARDAYNLACMASRAGELDQALGALRRSAELGLAFPSTLARDEDLDAIRGATGFAEVAERVRKNGAAELDRARPALDVASLVTILPPAARKRAAPGEPPPLIVALHGYGGTPDPLAEIYRGPAARLGAILVLPRGQERVGSGYGWGVIEQAEYLVLRAIERTAGEHSFGQVVVSGFSQGAGVALTIAARYPQKFAGVVAVAGHFEERLIQLPAPLPLPFPAFYFMSGELDVAAGNNRLALRTLEKAGVRARGRFYTGIGHQFPASDERDRELGMALRFALGR